MTMPGPNSFDPITTNELLPYGESLIEQGDDNSELFSIEAVFENGFLFSGRTFDELLSAPMAGSVLSIR